MMMSYMFEANNPHLINVQINYCHLLFLQKFNKNGKRKVCCGSCLNILYKDRCGSTEIHREPTQQAVTFVRSRDQYRNKMSVIIACRFHCNYNVCMSPTHTRVS